MIVTEKLDAPPVGGHGWAAMAMGSGGFADLKLGFPGLIDQNRAAFAVGAMAGAARRFVG
jgi:hypothetical protein